MDTFACIYVCICAWVLRACTYIRMWVYGCMRICVRLCAYVYLHLYICMYAFFHPVVIELKSNSKRKVSFKAFIFLGSQLALISFLGLKSISSILRCCIMPTKTKLPIIWKHCLYTARKSSFLVGIFPHSDWIRRFKE